MKINQEVDKGNFDRMLEWLSVDRSDPGASFERIRAGLIRFFRIKGAHDPETLADETMNRVINRFDSLDTSTGVNPTTIFYGFANKVFLEFLRTEKRRMVQFGDDTQLGIAGTYELPVDPALDCLRSCLGALKKWDGNLIVEYYSENPESKVDSRLQLAQLNQMTMTALQTKIHRIKGILRPCIEKCIDSDRSVRK